MLGEHSNSRVTLVSISNTTKLLYAKENPQVDADLLIRSRDCKEQHRKGLSEFYEMKKRLDPAFDRKCFVEAVQNKTNDGILILTGLRNGHDYAKFLAGRPVLFILVNASDESKKRRGWNGFVEGIDDSENERIEDRAQWDLTYTNGLDSTRAKASSWVADELAPAIVKSSIRQICDSPEKGIVYKDIVGGLLTQPFGISLATALIIRHIEREPARIDAVLAPEALGFILAAPVASALCLPLLIARKVAPVFGAFDKASSNGSNISKLARTCEQEYETDSHHFFMMSGSVLPGQRILVVDDCLATGATLEALGQLVDSQGGTITKFASLMEMNHPDLKGREVGRSIDVFSVTQFQGQ